MCAGVEITSLEEAAEIEREGHLDGKPQEIEVVHERASAVDTPRASGRALTVVVRGPVLGAMDSAKVMTQLACTAKGFALTATVTRSADYHGAVLANVNWRPKITIRAVLRQAKVTFEWTWRMRLTTGVELDHAQTPPYPDRSEE